MLASTEFDVSGERFSVKYQIADDDAEARAKHLVVEQTIEFPEHLVPEDSIREHIIGRIESIESAGLGAKNITVSYSIESSGFNLPQLLNVVFGNISLQPGVRVLNLDLPDSVLNLFKGPRFGRDGLRDLLGELEYPLFCTALKPMGLSSNRLAEQAAQYVKGGFQLIKDDHGLSNQPMATFRKRVPKIVEAVRNANAKHGSNCLYLPSLNGPSEKLAEDAYWAVEQGVGGLMLLPGICGLDVMRRFAEDDGLGVPILAHPAFMGSFVSSPQSGLSHRVIFGQLARLAGADATIYPNFGGRFSFTEKQCQEIALSTEVQMGHLRSIFPAPGGGMRLDNISDMIRVYGRDVMFLVGGALHDGDESIPTRCRMLIDKVHDEMHKQYPESDSEEWITT